jgi:hypothetical protein
MSLLGALALIAAVAGLRESGSPAPPSPSIDRILTRDESGCARVRSTEWHPLSGVDYTGRLRLGLPPQLGGAVILYIGDSIPLDVEATDEVGDPVPMHAERMTAGPGRALPPDFWLDDGSPDAAPGQIIRIQLDASGERARALRLSLGRRAPRVLARLVGYPSRTDVQVCADPVGRDEIVYATGWYGQERDPAEGPIRWMQEHGVVLVSSADGRGVRVHARLSPVPEVAEAPGAEVGLRVNDTIDVGGYVLRPGFRDYEWVVPDAAWVAGTNELLFRVSRTARIGSRRLGLALASLNIQ